ncbi:hypothetical protein MTR67_048732 [Solanum verrucosum]|uniref:Uncharacterized protein n=1 Tax=Solanum verrucosum TaxID=315347 RepID=A0AAF0UZG6_SOLVR|nr:hypothetical protein MTR67_048732 [Solanum verrucosum]
MKKAMGSKMKIDIPVGKGRPTKPVQLVKLSNELGIIARNFISLPNKWKELTREDRDAALIRCHKRCDINKVNRTKLKSNHFMGSKAFVAARAELGENEPEKEEPDRIELYKHTHYKSKKGWSSLEAGTHYTTLLDRGLGQKIQYDLNQQVQGDTEAKLVPICVKFVLNKMLAYRDPAPFYFPKGKGVEDLPDALIALSMWLSEKE